MTLKQRLSRLEQCVPVNTLPVRTQACDLTILTDGELDRLEGYLTRIKPVGDCVNEYNTDSLQAAEIEDLESILGKASPGWQKED